MSRFHPSARVLLPLLSASVFAVLAMFLLRRGRRAEPVVAPTRRPAPPVAKPVVAESEPEPVAMAEPVTPPATAVELEPVATVEPEPAVAAEPEPYLAAEPHVEPEPYVAAQPQPEPEAPPASSPAPGAWHSQLQQPEQPSPPTELGERWSA
jgi:hypothetical protein